MASADDLLVDNLRGKLDGQLAALESTDQGRGAWLDLHPGSAVPVMVSQAASSASCRPVS